MRGGVDMRRIILLTVMLALVAIMARAGERDPYISLNVGLLHPRVLNISGSYQIETAYSNAYEIYVDYQTQWNTCPVCGKVCMNSFWKSCYSYAAGLAYKKSIHRGKNTTTRIRFGADLGSANRSFAASLEAGVEYALTIRGGVQVVFSEKNELMFFGKPTWKIGVLMGIRVPM